jgi:hypothetical protein
MPTKSKNQKKKKQSPLMGTQNLSFVPYDNPETEFKTYQDTNRTTQISLNQEPYIKYQQTKQFSPYESPKKPSPPRPIPAPRTMKKPIPAPRPLASLGTSNTQFLQAANQMQPHRPIPAPRTLKKHTPPKPAPQSMVSLRTSNTQRKKTSPRQTQINPLMTLKFPPAPN